MCVCVCVSFLCTNERNTDIHPPSNFAIHVLCSSWFCLHTGFVNAKFTFVHIVDVDICIIEIIIYDITKSILIILCYATRLQKYNNMAATITIANYPSSRWKSGSWIDTWSGDPTDQVTNCTRVPGDGVDKTSISTSAFCSRRNLMRFRLLYLFHYMYMRQHQNSFMLFRSLLSESKWCTVNFDLQNFEYHLNLLWTEFHYYA